MMAGFILLSSGKSDKKKAVSLILIGFASLMFGMNMMSDAMSGLKDSEVFGKLLVMFSNPLMGILVGALLTAIIQSSSASIGVLQALSLTGAIPFSTAIPIILGQNIGTTITPIISSITGNTESRRVALCCLYIKMIGVAAVSAVFYLLNGAIGFSFMAGNVDMVSIATIHTVFNLASAILLLPFSKWIERLTVLTVKTKKEEANSRFDTLDERFLAVPSFAIEKSRELVCEMAEIAQGAVLSSMELLSRYDGKTVTKLLHCISDIERIADHAVNIARLAKELEDKGIHFSDSAYREVKVISTAVLDVLNLATDAFLRDDLELAGNVEPLEQVIDRLKLKIKDNHIVRLQNGQCSVVLGFILSDLLNNFARIADHCSNIAVCLIEISHGSFETHEYLNRIKQTDTAFARQYEFYKQKYLID